LITIYKVFGDSHTTCFLAIFSHLDFIHIYYYKKRRGEKAKKEAKNKLLLGVFCRAGLVRGGTYTQKETRGGANV